MTRDERQELGIKKWIAVKGCGTMCYATGVGIGQTSKIYFIKEYIPYDAV